MVTLLCPVTRPMLRKLRIIFDEPHVQMISGYDSKIKYNTKIESFSLLYIYRVNLIKKQQCK